MEVLLLLLSMLFSTQPEELAKESEELSETQKVSINDEIKGFASLVK